MFLKFGVQDDYDHSLIYGGSGFHCLHAFSLVASAPVMRVCGNLPCTRHTRLWLKQAGNTPEAPFDTPLSLLFHHVIHFEHLTHQWFLIWSQDGGGWIRPHCHRWGWRAHPWCATSALQDEHHSTGSVHVFGYLGGLLQDGLIPLQQLVFN